MIIASFLAGLDVAVAIALLAAIGVVAEALFGFLSALVGRGGSGKSRNNKLRNKKK